MSALDKVMPEADTELQLALHKVHEQMGGNGLSESVQVDVMEEVKEAVAGRTRDEILTELGTWYMNCKARAAAKKAELDPLIKEMQAEIKYFEQRLEFVKWAIQNVLRPGMTSDFVNDKVSMFYQKSEKLIVNDPESVPIEYCKVVSTPQPAQIKQDMLDHGLHVEGCEIETKYNLQVKPGGERAIKNAAARRKRRKEKEDE